MSTASPTLTSRGNPDYPSGDGKPMAESTVHWHAAVDLIQTLADRFADDPMVAVGGNLLMYYVPGDKQRRVAPDVYVTFGVPKEPKRLNYIVWEEGKVPDFVIEVTSKTRRKEDQHLKLALYRDVLKIPEYVLFDPKEEYLKPSFQGYRLVGDTYEPMAVVAGRLRSVILGLDLAREGESLRLFDPATGAKLLTRSERAEAERERAEIERQRARIERERAEAERERAEAERERAETAEAEVERLRREIEALRRGRDGGA